MKRMTKKMFIFSIVVFIVALATIFLWNETFDITKKINYEKTGFFFTTLGSMATAISIIIFYFQLLAGSRPDLYPAQAPFNVEDVNRSQGWETNPKPSVQIKKVIDEQVQENLYAYLDLHNIGSGAAKDIHLAWKYRKEDVIKMIKEHYFYYQDAEPEKDHFDFLQAGGKLLMKLPELYVICCGKEVNPIVLDLIPPVSAKVKPKPTLNLELSYQDIQNNSYRKIFYVEVDAVDAYFTFKFRSDKEKKKSPKTNVVN